MTTPGPIIYQNQPTPSQVPHFSWPFFLFRIISLILVVFILFMLFQAVMLFLTQRGTNLGFSRAVLTAAHSPSISLSPAQTNLTVGQTGAVSINYFTGNKTIQGIDVVIKYNPDILEFSPAGFFRPGTVFSQYPISQASGDGTIRISAVATVAEVGFSGSGVLGTLQFTAKKTGQTKLDIVFQPDQTTDSNLVDLQTSQEILQLVQGSTITIK